jgi:hypothetical protein
LCDATHFGPNCSSTVTDDLAEGFCKDLHTWEITGLGTTYYSALSALFLFLSFIWILRANNKNMRLAIAGPEEGSKGGDDDDDGEEDEGFFGGGLRRVSAFFTGSGKVITISWYTKVMDAAMIWAIGWSVYKFFSVDHGSAVRSGNAGDAQKWHYAATAVVRAYVMPRRPPRDAAPRSPGAPLVFDLCSSSPSDHGVTITPPPPSLSLPLLRPRRTATPPASRSSPSRCSP